MTPSVVTVIWGIDKQYLISTDVLSTRFFWKAGRRDRRSMMREGSSSAGTGTNTRVMAAVEVVLTKPKRNTCAQG